VFSPIPKYPKNLPNNKFYHKNTFTYLQNPKDSFLKEAKRQMVLQRKALIGWAEYLLIGE